MYGDNVKTAAGAPEGSFMRVNQGNGQCGRETRTLCSKQASTLSVEQSAETWNRKSDGIEKAIDPEYYSRNDCQRTRRCNQ
jgi:hypothetical protein